MAQALSSGRRGVLFIPLPANVNNYAITTATTITVPAATTGIILFTDADIWVSTGQPAVIGGSVTDGTGSVFMTKGQVLGFDVVPAQTFSVVSVAGTANVAVGRFT